MSYITLPQLAESPGARELAQVASAEHLPVVDVALMDLTLRGNSRTAYSADEIAAADAAAARVSAAITSAAELIDAHLARRMTTPVSPVPGVLTRIARQLVRHDLHRHLISDRDHPIRTDYRDAIALLESIRDGRVSIGAGDAIATSEPALISVTSRERIFDRRTLGGL